ncbi:MAG: DNA topoisomerase 1 [Sclerophora amabilis]|nr:MAG: DNA topoisomerase 1 [Sclerophora amabilis]
MSSSEDDAPILNGRKAAQAVKPPISKDSIPKSLDASMDRAVPSANRKEAGISLHNGPIDEMEIDQPDLNGVVTNGKGGGKRKSRQSASTGRNYKEASSDDEDDEPLSKRRRTSAGQPKKHTAAPEIKSATSSESDDEPILEKKAASGKKSALSTVVKSPNVNDSINLSPNSNTPVKQKLAKAKATIEKRAEKEAKEIRKEVKTNGSANPLKKKQPKKGDSDIDEPKPKSRGKKKQANGVKEELSEDDDIPISQKVSVKKPPAKVKAEPSTSAKKVGKGKAVKKEETPDKGEAEVLEEEEENRWWEDLAKGDGTKKWSTLEHAGVIFPPPYEPLPSNVKMRYDGTPINLHPDAEEVAGFFGTMLNSTLNVSKKTFCDNFFHDFKEIISKTGGAKDKDGNKIKIKDFSRCDFEPIFNYYEAKRMEKKALSTAEKKQIKAEKDAIEAPFTYCLWDGRKEKVGNFRVEPPGLFRGRGEHPKTGHVKKRVLPEQITINIGKEATVPAPPEGHKWKQVKHDHEGTWLAMWQENINGNFKYVMLAANSTVKGQSDFKKFEKARELKKYIDKIRKDYKRGLKAELMADRQQATAVYLIDQFALRAGNEKGEDEADTVGCCSLKFEHVTLKPPNKVVFDFLGKDSIRFYDEVVVDPQVFKNLKIFKKAPKKDGDEIFDRLTTTKLNKHLGHYMPGLSAKVFRTYNASYTMANLLRDMKSEGTIPEKVKDYNDANRQVAILCNHKRTVTAGHAGQMEKMSDKTKGLKYQKWRIKQMMLAIDPKIKKKRGAEYFELGDELDQEWILEHQNALVEEQRQKIEKKFQKDNEKLAAEGEKEMKPKELKERMEAADELAAKYKKENKTKKIEPEGKGPTIEKMEANLEKLDQRIATMLVQAEDRENNKDIALGTSKINYIDPRLTVVFSKKFNVPIEKFFSKTLREKFDWAIKSVNEDWEF